MNRDQALGTAERLVSIAIARGADEAEVYIGGGRSLGVDIEAGKVAMTSSDATTGYGIRVVVDGRVGFASCSGFDDGEKTADAAIRLARHSPNKGYSLPEPTGPTSPANQFDDDIALMDPEDALTSAQALLDAWKAHGSDLRFPGGGTGQSAGWGAIASSRGVEAFDQATSNSAAVSLVLEGKATISAWDSEVDWKPGIDLTELTTRTIDKIRRLDAPKEAAFTGEVDIVWSPECTGQLYSQFLASATDGDSALRGNTAWADKLGEAVANPGLSFSDDPLADDAKRRTLFDDEGLTTSRLELLKDGVLNMYRFDSWDGHEHGQQSTASATRGGFDSRPSTGMHRTVLTHAMTKPLDQMIATVDEGYLVDTVLGAHTANATTGDYSVSAPNVWAIKDGSIEHAVEGVALSGSIPQQLKHAEMASVEGRAGMSSWTPNLLVRNVHASL